DGPRRPEAVGEEPARVQTELRVGRLAALVALDVAGDLHGLDPRAVVELEAGQSAVDVLAAEAGGGLELAVVLEAERGAPGVREPMLREGADAARARRQEHDAVGRRVDD